MSSVGIIANPASGKDIRRLVSHATVIDNNEKINIIERLILGAQQCGVEKFYLMPDSYHMGYRVIDKLKTSKELKADIEILNMYIYDSVEDTINAAQMMEEMGVGCLVVLGGDGTNRAAAKSIQKTPLIGISTGTNNVYPEMIEGTVAGMAAAVVASRKYDSAHLVKKDKRIEIYRNGTFTDIALIDAVVSKDVFVGAKAIWNVEDIAMVFVSKCHPASIGFSSVVGAKTVITEEDNFGAFVNVNVKECNIMAPMAAGLVIPVSISTPKKLNIDEYYEYIVSFKGTIAVDGEREIVFQKGDRLAFRITRNGPNHVDIKKTLEVAQQNGFFETVG
jgi:predicted polyphosphate/ATP-dependent NAD kinase